MTGFLMDRDLLQAVENPRGSAKVKHWIEAVPDNDLYISSITVMESRKGFAKARLRAKSPAEAEEIRAFEADFNDLLESFDDRVLPVNRGVADLWGEMLGQRDANVMDAGIAATAACFGLVVVTRNLKHFRGRGVPVLKPFTDVPRVRERSGG